MDMEQLMHVYWPMYESGGIFFHQLFNQVRCIVSHVASAKLGYSWVHDSTRYIHVIVQLVACALVNRGS